MKKFSKFVLIVIPARKNSIRLKNKNLKKIDNKTLVENSVIFAKKFKKVSDIVVSTDSKKIKDIIKKKYREIYIHDRQKKFSGPKSETLILLNKITKWYYLKNNNNNIKCVLLLQPTTPFRSYTLVKKTLNNFKKNKNKINFVSVSSNSLKNNLYINQKKILQINNKKDQNCYVNGNFYIFNKLNMRKNLKETILKHKTKGVVIKNKKYLIDIDNYCDLKFARSFK